MRSGLQQDFRPRLPCFPLLGGCVENCLAKQTSARELLGLLITAFWPSMLDKHFCRMPVPWHSSAADFQSGDRYGWEGSFSEQLSFYSLDQRPPAEIPICGERLGPTLEPGKKLTGLVIPCLLPEAKNPSAF